MVTAKAMPAHCHRSIRSRKETQTGEKDDWAMWMGREREGVKREEKRRGGQDMETATVGSEGGRSDKEEMRRWKGDTVTAV